MLGVLAFTALYLLAAALIWFYDRHLHLYDFTPDDPGHPHPLPIAHDYQDRAA